MSDSSHIPAPSEKMQELVNGMLDAHTDWLAGNILTTNGQKSSQSWPAHYTAYSALLREIARLEAIVAHHEAFTKTVTVVASL